MTQSNTLEPHFSIVTVVFNDLPGLAVTRASVDAQNLRSFEWIVIDGASTDGAAEYLRKYREAQPDHPFAAISEPDQGIYDAMNKGLALATGRFVLFMNAGDAFANSTVLNQAATATASAEYDFLYGDALESAGPGKPLLLKRARNIRAIRYGMFTHHQAMFYRREFLARHNLHYDQRIAIAADYAFTANVFRMGCTALQLRFPICIFARGGISYRAEAEARRQVLHIQRDILGLNRLLLLRNEAGFRLASFLRKYFRRAYDAVRFRRHE